MVHLGQLMLKEVVVVYISRAVGHPLRWHEQQATAELIGHPRKHLLPLAENQRSEIAWTPEVVTLAVLLSLQKTTEDGDQNLNIITSSDGVFQSALSSKVTKKFTATAVPHMSSGNVMLHDLVMYTPKGVPKMASSKFSLAKVV
jgi:hypothetical protein